MNRKKWRWSLALALPLGIAGFVFAGSYSRGYVCPLTGETLPCENCCPLKSGQPFTCPLTGEALPCPKCCPLNQK
jgi:hypothetical protein